MKVAFTGHRPNKIGGYDDNNPKRRAIKKAINGILIRLSPTFVITGGALGIDIDAAREAYKLGIPYSVVAPCRNHSSKWNQHAQKRYDIMCKLAYKHIINDVKYSPYAMQERNKQMVDECDVLVAVLDGTSGGTANCVEYATKIGKEVIRINPNDY